MRNSWTAVNTVTVITSLVALLVSIWLPLFLDRRHDPRVRVRGSKAEAFGEDDTGFGGRCYLITVANRGRSPIKVRHWGWILEGTANVSLLPERVPHGSKPHLPAVAGPHDMIRCAIDLDDTEQILHNEHPSTTELRAFVDLSTGVRKTAWRATARPKTRPGEAFTHPDDEAAWVSAAKKRPPGYQPDPFWEYDQSGRTKVRAWLTRVRRI
jgi:hypothetical protein